MKHKSDSNIWVLFAIIFILLLLVAIIGGIV